MNLAAELLEHHAIVSPRAKEREAASKARKNTKIRFWPYA
jgi:hypothetical protein